MELGMTVAQLRHQMPASEFTDWIAFCQERERRTYESQNKARADAEKKAKREQLTGRRVAP
jgi:hypothetical protein